MLTRETIPLGRSVHCDMCNADHTDSDESGGFIFGSNAYCPSCARTALPDIVRYDESHLIRARCPAGQSFGDFVRQWRGPDAEIVITSSDKLKDLFPWHEEEIDND